MSRVDWILRGVTTAEALDAIEALEKVIAEQKDAMVVIADTAAKAAQAQVDGRDAEIRVHQATIRLLSTARDNLTKDLDYALGLITQARGFFEDIIAFADIYSERQAKIATLALSRLPAKP